MSPARALLAPCLAAILVCAPAAGPAGAQPAPQGEAGAGPVGAPNAAPNAASLRAPYEWVRTLQALQERVANGDVAAHRGQRALIQRMARAFAAADPTIWADPRNAHGAIAFALGGGPPGTLEALIADEVPFGADRALARGALAFVLGREEEARALLEDVDPRALGGLLGAQVALARSALAVRESPREALRLLAIARLLAPGTLVEEAALRREIFVAGNLGEIERLEFLATQYMRRFRHSVYAGNFRQRFAVLLTTLAYDVDLDRFAGLEALLDRFDGESRRDLYLFFARHALIHGRDAVARRAASRAAELSAGGSAEEERATFYAAASQIATPRHRLAAQTLADIDARRLPPADRLLLEVALDVAIRIGAPVAPRVFDGRSEGAGEGEARPLPPTPTMVRAEAALSAAAALLAEARR